MPRTSPSASGQHLRSTTEDRLEALARTLQDIVTDLESHLQRERLSRLLDDAGYPLIDRDAARHHHLDTIGTGP